MTPRGRRPQWYAVYDMGRVIAIKKGAAEARKLGQGRAYTAFKTRIAAEEHAMWWNHHADQERPWVPSTTVQTDASSQTRQNHPA